MSTAASRTHAVVAFGAALTALIAPTPAHAVTLGLDQRCYIAGEAAALSGSGFSKGPVRITRADTEIKPTDADASGSIRTRLEVPALPDDALEEQTEIVATDGTVTGRAMMNVVRAGADYEVGDDRNPRTMRVRHTVSGFGLSLNRASVYLHYVSPAAQRAAKNSPSTSSATKSKNKSTAGGSAGIAANPPGVYTRRIGLLRGPCGVLKTSPRRLFPFRATKGKWELQYDTNPRYTRGVSSSPFYWVRKSVTIK